MKVIIASMLVLALGSVTAWSDIINFTTAEGYSAGLLRDNEDWTVPADAGFYVDPTGGGSVTNVGAQSFRLASYAAALPSGLPEYTLSTEFAFNHAGTETISGNENVFVNAFEHADGNLFLFLTRRDNADDFRLTFFKQSGGNATLASAWFAATEMGLSGNWSEVSSTDRLQLSMTIGRGVDEADWTVNAFLRNLDSDELLTDLSGTFATAQAFFDDDVQTAFGSRNAVDGADLSPMTVHSFESIPEPASMVLLVLGGVGCLLVRKSRRG